MMAADWIKMRGNLWDDPRIARICDITDQPEAMVVGALYWLWASADQHTEDGLLPGLSTRAIDRKTGVAGFADALIQIGWLADHPEGVRIVKFTEHNGASAKRRAEDAKRKGLIRKMSAENADTTRTNDGQLAPVCGTRERERERKDTPPKPPAVAFERFWSEYPRKVGKEAAAKAWNRVKADAATEQAMFAALDRQRKTDDWQREGGRFIPHAATWLNGRRWEDEAGPVAGKTARPWWVERGYGSEADARKAEGAPA